MHWTVCHTLVYAIISIIFNNVASASAVFVQGAEENVINSIQEHPEEQHQWQERQQQQQQWPIPFQRAICGTEEPSKALIDAHKRLSSIDFRYIDSNDGNRTTTESFSRIQVDTWFHIVSTSDQVDLVTNLMIASQFVYLQEAYASTGIHYRLVGVDRSINDTWARNGDALAMKQTLRKGSYSTLNVYFQTDLEISDPSSVNSRNITATTSSTTSIGGYDNGDRFSRDFSLSSTANLLGFCTLPDPKINSSSPTEDYINDGCNILADTMPGGSIEHYNRGGTAVHEVGHWHGLLHVFQDETCDSGSEGDYITDTPQQSVPTDGCPASKDSCPDLPGLDAISNFMDYSSDDCYQNFTQDQAMRMRNMWSVMREGK